MSRSTYEDNRCLPSAPLAHLKERARLLASLRAFFEGRRFWEVQTSTLSADTMIDRHLDPYQVILYSDPTRVEVGPTWYLQTSPEFQMKRLLAAGADAIYQVCPAFRAAESGPLHNGEFTIVEWYRVGDDRSAGMDLLDELMMHLLGTLPAERLTYAEAFRRHVGIDPLEADVAALQALVTDGGPHAEDRDELLHWLMASCVEPQLAPDRPTIIYHFPASQGALARLCSEDQRVAERFELYFRGIELANGYDELLDPVIFAERLRENNRQRQADQKNCLPEENRLRGALQRGIPGCTGVALGWDRLVMLALGATSIEQVMAFPMDRA